MVEKQIEQSGQKEEGDIITFDEYVNEMFQQEKDALTQLKKDESTICSFNKGHINQTIFGCKTCGIKKAGFCLACYLNCHLDHDTFEIGLKRNFQCECGVSEFFNDCCSLQQNKQFTASNEQKDHNFEDQFCSCNQQYKKDEFMINCVSCLDYFHLNHIGLNENEEQIVKQNDNLTEMICPECLKNIFAFLLKYKDNKLIVFSLTTENIEKNEEQKQINIDQFNEQGKRLHQEECLLKNYDKQIQTENISKPLFLVRNWQNYICYCDTCQQLYKKINLSQIEDVNDQNANLFNEDYEELAAPAPITQSEIDEIEQSYEKQFKQMIQHDFIASSTIAHAVNQMREEFLEFLKPFYETHEVVTPDHIKEFFRQFNSKHKLKKNDDN